MKKINILDKRSRTSIMFGVIICLFIAVLFCVVKIALRPAVVKEDNNFYLPVKEEIDIDYINEQVAAKQESVHIDVENRARLIEDNVNIRSGPGTDFERLGSAYKGFDYKIISGENDEWVKIEYDNRQAYVFSEYVEIVPMFLNDMGEYEEYVVMDDDSESSGKEEKDPVSDEADESED